MRPDHRNHMLNDLEKKGVSWLYSNWMLRGLVELVFLNME